MKYLALIVSLLLASHALAGSVSIQVTETGQTTQTKTFSVADADIDKIVATYQNGANVSINGTATRAQVLLYWIMSTLVADTQTAVQQFETPAPVVPPTIPMQ